jgi:hypothetical protein
MTYLAPFPAGLSDGNGKVSTLQFEEEAKERERKIDGSSDVNKQVEFGGKGEFLLIFFLV